MFGECHAHVIMDGKNYKAAVALHKERPNEAVIREHLSAWQQADITFVRDGGDAYGVSERARELAGEYGIDYRTPFLLFIREDITAVSLACPMTTGRDTGSWCRRPGSGARILSRL